MLLATAVDAPAPIKASVFFPRTLAAASCWVATAAASAAAIGRTTALLAFCARCGRDLSPLHGARRSVKHRTLSSFILAQCRCRAFASVGRCAAPGTSVAAGV